MTTKAIKIFRETALPAVPSLEADAIYFIAPASKPDYIEIYVTNTAKDIRRVINRDDIQTLINSAVASVSELTVVDNIAARNALAPTRTAMVLVLDATGDPTVNSGSATYVYKTVSSTWEKITEYEGLDMVVTWNSLQGKPTSTPNQIDSAVSVSHTHNNKTQLDKIGQDANGNLTYNNSLPATGWSSTGW